MALRTKGERIVSTMTWRALDWIRLESSNATRQDRPKVPQDEADKGKKEASLGRKKTMAEKENGKERKRERKKSRKKEKKKKEREKEKEREGRK